MRAAMAAVLSSILVGCVSSADKAMERMQKIKEATPDIMEIRSASTTVPFEGISITESDIMMRDSALNHLFIIEVELGGNLTLRPSSPGDQPFSREMGQQNMLEQAKAADENGHKVYLGINADVFG